MNKPDKEYLQELLLEAQRSFEQFQPSALELSESSVSYIPTKKRNYMGLKLGISGLAEMKRYNVKESPTVRSNCGYYHKLYKVDGKLVRIDSYANGHDRLSDSRVAYYEDDCRYLFPYHGQTKATWLYIIVTRWCGDRVTEEYMVGGNQIVYEKYDHSEADRVGYYRINYVPTGKYPVLEESEGYFAADTFEYVEESNYVWYQDE